MRREAAAADMVDSENLLLERGKEDGKMGRQGFFFLMQLFSPFAHLLLVPPYFFPYLSGVTQMARYLENLICGDWVTLARA